MIMYTQDHFDYIIAGGGCAGLSLAYHLLQTPLQKKRILLIDKDDKTANDRTWCFWEKEPGPFEEIVYKKWNNLYFYGEGFSKLLNISPYQYKMVRGIDFYQFVEEQISKFENLQVVRGHIQNTEDTPQGGKVTVDGKTYTADWVFNSLPPQKEKISLNGYYHLLQHFKGWVIHTGQAVFKPGEATLMDFRVAQYNDTRFVYVLPTDAHTALVEYTVFSASLLKAETYDNEIEKYIRDFLKIDAYQVIHEEFGIIPMTNQPFPARQGKHIVNIGTAGGQTKSSTGYTFTRIQQQTQQIVKDLLCGKEPGSNTVSSKNRFWWYDSILLNVLFKNRSSGKQIFTSLFKYNNASNILSFLDEKTNIFQELKITNTVPRLPFLKAALDILIKK